MTIHNRHCELPECRADDPDCTTATAHCDHPDWVPCEHPDAHQPKSTRETITTAVRCEYGDMTEPDMHVWCALHPYSGVVVLRTGEAACVVSGQRLHHGPPDPGEDPREVEDTIREADEQARRDQAWMRERL